MYLSTALDSILNFVLQDPLTDKLNLAVNDLIL
jgi:hypothetical protein